MKTTLSAIVAFVLLIAPTTSSAYFIQHFRYQQVPVTTVTPRYTPDPTAELLPGWPDWIGRLNAFSVYLYGKRFNNLTQNQKVVVEKLSKNWPGWIGVPFYLR